MDDCKGGLVNYQDIYEALQGWNAYAMHGNTYKLRQRIAAMVEGVQGI